MFTRYNVNIFRLGFAEVSSRVSLLRRSKASGCEGWMGVMRPWPNSGRLFAALVGLLWFGALVSRANTYYVATNGPGGGATTWATATNNIQDAISLCSSNDTVLVSNGVYETGGVTNWPGGTSLTNRVAITTAYITVRSANNDPTNTIIKGTWDPNTTNGPAAVRCVYMTDNSTLIGFMLTNGATLATGGGGAQDRYGGGVHCPGITTPTISNCIMAGNSAKESGGGAYYGTLYNCTLTGNSASNGGGAYGGKLYNCTLISNSASSWGGGVYDSTLYNCTLVSNSAEQYGGGAHSGTLSNCTLTGNSSQYGGGMRYGTMYNCTIASNSAVYGAGICSVNLYNCILVGNSAAGTGGGAYGGTLYNCTLIGNSAPYGGGMRSATLYNCTLVGNSATQQGGGAYDGTLYNCIIYFNYASVSGSNWSSVASFINCCTTTAQVGWASGNITADPIFITNGSGYGASHVAGNYRLRANSPCVNTGTNQAWMTTTYPYDRDGRTRIRYGTVDMGAYELIYSGTIYVFH